MSKGDKKQRREMKRKAKRQAVRRREAGSPVKRLAEAGGEVECWMSEDFEGNGQAQILAFKRGAGLTGVACFLVDRGVVGLKDSWTRVGIEHGKFEEMLDRAGGSGIRMRRAGVEEVRRRIAGGVRWAHENGMRLPKDWAKHALLIGGVGEWASADVSEFAKEFAGHPEDLRQRLIGEPLESYVRRGDVDFQFDESAPYKDQRTGRYAQLGGLGEEGLDEEDLESIAADVPVEELNKIADRFAPSAKGLAAGTAEWLAGRDETPSPELAEAWTSMILAACLSKMAMPDAEDEAVMDFGFKLLEGMAGRVDASRLAEYQRAVDQTLAHARTDPQIMQKAIMEYGLVGDEGPDEGEGEET